MSTVIFCADDYALNTPISQAILQLLEQGRLHATSCMTQAPDWAEHGTRLRELKHKLPHIQAGLHFNLTYDFADGRLFVPLGPLMIKAWLRILPKDRIHATLSDQWQRFIDVMGQAPDFIDGHQHVHQFPVIRTVLLTFITNQGYSGWIRNLSHTVATPGYFIKSKALSLLGARALAWHCEALHFRQNAQFAGVYDFSDRVPYRGLVLHWLQHAHPALKNDTVFDDEGMHNSLLIMCHPAINNTDTTDTIADARVREYLYLASPQFIKDCTENQITLGYTPKAAHPPIAPVRSNPNDA